MNRQQMTEQLNKRLKRSAIRLIAVSMALGFLLGLGAGLLIADLTIERTVIVPLTKGVEV
jgi:L-asparagine transporter-like permease